MKAIPRQPKPAILAFNFEGERYDTLKALCDELDWAIYWKAVLSPRRPNSRPKPSSR